MNHHPNSPRLGILLVASGALLLGACASQTSSTVADRPGVAVPPGAAPCDDPTWGWSATNPPVNTRHVFCGEVDGAQHRPKGFHSNQLLAESTVVTAINNIRNVRNGIYDADVSFAAPAQPNVKMSTFFPDACTVGQITASIVYAVTHQVGPHPQWGVLGPSAPQAGAAGYCLDSTGSAFEIRMGLLQNGDVNTAFPN